MSFGSVIQYSPGVAIREIDLTSYVRFEGVSPAATVGDFTWGPVQTPYMINNIDQFIEAFGQPNDRNYVDWYGCFNFLSYSSSLFVTRVINEIGRDNDGFFEATSINQNGDVVDSDGNELALNSTTSKGHDGRFGVLIKNEDHYRIVDASLQSKQYQFAARYPGILGDSITIEMVDSNSFIDKGSTPEDPSTWSYWKYADEFNGAPSTSPSADRVRASNDELHIIIIDSRGLFTGTPGAILEKYEALSKARDAKSLDGAPIFYGNVINNQSKYVWFLGGPQDYELVPANYLGNPKEDMLVFGGANYDPASPPVITVTGGLAGVPAGDPSVPIELIPVMEDTGFANGGQRIDYLTVANEGAQYQWDPENDPITVTVTGGVAVSGSTNVIDAAAITITMSGSGYNVGDLLKFSGQTPEIEAVVTVKTIDSNGSITDIEVVDGGQGYNTTDPMTLDDIVTVEGNTAGVIAATIDIDSSVFPSEAITIKDAVISITPEHLVRFESDTWGVPMQSPSGSPRSFASLRYSYSKAFQGGQVGSLPSPGDIIRGWNEYENPEAIDFSIAFSNAAGGNSTSSAVINNHIINNICEKRKDCVLCLSPPKDAVVNQTQNDATNKILDFYTRMNQVSSYAIMDSGWKLQYDTFSDEFRWIPLNADIAGLCAATDVNYDPWWSPAGLTRGRIKNITSLAFNPNKSARDLLYKSSINPVVTFKGEGTILYGDKTMLNRASAFGYINVRRLFIVLQKSIAKAARNSLFEFNDSFTRAQFVSMVEPFLRTVKSRRGIYDFMVVCDSRNNTPDIIDRAEFVGDIYIKPARSINFITLNFVAVRTGVDFKEVAG